jgi:hypothetical protein
VGYGLVLKIETGLLWILSLIVDLDSLTGQLGLPRPHNDEWQPA